MISCCSRGHYSHHCWRPLRSLKRGYICFFPKYAAKHKGFLPYLKNCLCTPSAGRAGFPLVFLWFGARPLFSHGFPLVFLQFRSASVAVPPLPAAAVAGCWAPVFLGFCFGFPTVSPCLGGCTPSAACRRGRVPRPLFSYGFPWFSYGFPLVFPWFSYGFPTLSALGRWLW